MTAEELARSPVIRMAGSDGHTYETTADRASEMARAARAEGVELRPFIRSKNKETGEEYDLNPFDGASIASAQERGDERVTTGAAEADYFSGEALKAGATRFALVAGFTEIGETVEETVHREVMEEVGLKVKNLRYYKSQPWGISGGGLLMGYWCEVDGDDAIHVDHVELDEGAWVSREELRKTYHDTGVSLTGEMIAKFAIGEEHFALRCE